jgi:hypothetical protein
VIVRTVYLVTDGEYSDYSVRAVATTKALAEEIKAAAKFDRIEEMPLLDAMPTPYTLYVRERVGRGDYERTEVVWPWDEWLHNVPKNGRPVYKKFPVGWRVAGRDKAQVDKAWQDRDAQERAEREGIA